MIGPDALTTLDTGAAREAMACGTHLSCGILIERCGHESEVGASDKGKTALGSLGGFRPCSLLGAPL